MASHRSDILDWLDQGRLAPERLREAMDIAGALPTEADWQRFFDRLLLWMGAAMLAAAVIFFFAFNWHAMGRLAKIGLAELAMLGALALIWRLGLERPAGKATLFASSLLVGALFALIGQIYQTGADPWQLFALWAVAILPWVLVGRQSALWILWLALVNLAFAMNFMTMRSLWGLGFAPQKLLWFLFAFDTTALVVWEALAMRGLDWLRERWSQRILATASGAMVTALAVFDAVDWGNSSGWGLPAWLGWLAAAHGMYRRRIRDAYVLAGGLLSIIVVVSALFVRHLEGAGGGFLFLGLLIIGMSAAGGMWLKKVIAESDAGGSS